MKRYSLIHLAILLALALLLTPAPPARAAGTIHYAAPTAVGLGNCSSWTNACTLQMALNVAGSGDQIWVQKGVHYPGNAGNRTATFTLKNNVAIYGGFAGTETLLSQRNWRGNRTILSGDIDGNDNHGGDYINENASQIVGSNAYHVVTSPGGTNSSAVLDGFVITAGQANGSSPNDVGGGMYNQSSSPTLRNLIFSGNSAFNGGGMFNTVSSSPTLTNVTFSGNSATNGGGMLNASNSSPTLTNVAFSGNSAGSGGGMYNDLSNPTLTNVTFSGNSAFNGGGMFNNFSNPTLTNVILWGSTSGGSISNYGSNPTISYSLLQESSCPVSTSCGSGMIYNTNPQFVDADGVDNVSGTLDDNLRLQLTSPAIDAGNNAAPGLSGITTDLKGYPRFVDGNADNNAVVDMGAYEAQLISPLYAAPASLGEGNCSSWANACTLADALAFAMSGEQVWVKAGVHYPVATTSNPRQATFTLRNGVEIYGGFAGTETLLSQRNWRSNLTILSGDIDKNDADMNSNGIIEKGETINGANAYHVVTGGGTNSSAVLDGFVITAGQANGGSFPNDVGGGMYNSGSSPTLTNVTFSGNSATNAGGGMFNTGSSSPKLTNVTFSDNAAILGGGGMYNWSSSPTLTNVTFSGNSATNGGGMYNDGPSSPTLTNVTFSGNSATINGGGMYNDAGSAPTLTNVILWGSTGGSIFNIGSNPTISYSLIAESGCPGSTICGSGMIYNTDPKFVDADGVDNVSGTLDDNLRLQLTSPAIDAGNNAASGLSGITTDLEGNERFEDIPTVPDSGSGTPPIVDMGAYEGQDTIAPAVTVNQASTQADPTNSLPIYFVAVFSEPISTTTFTAGDVSLSGSTAPGATATGVTQIAPNDGTTFQITIGGMTGSGTVVVSIPAGGVQDPAGNGNLASTSSDNSVTYDITAPTVVSITRADPNPTSAASVQFIVTFSEVVTGVDAGDFSLTTTGSIAGAGVTGVSGAGSTYTVTVSTGTGSGTLRLDVPAPATITDPAGNGLSGLPYAGGEVYQKVVRMFLPLILR